VEGLVLLLRRGVLLSAEVGALLVLFHPRGECPWGGGAVEGEPVTLERGNLLGVLLSAEVVVLLVLFHLRGECP
jgi:hypothetical protein